MSNQQTNKRPKPSEREQRTITIEFRAAEAGSDNRTVEGYAALFGSESERLWDFYEVIEPGAFDNADLSDVRALFNHDPNSLLARTASGTLSLSVDEKGLFYRFEMPDTTLGNDLLEMLRRGDINQSSFAFTIKEDSWEEQDDRTYLRHIRQIDKVYDVSPVTYPAYSQTTATARSFEQACQEEEPQINNHLRRARTIQLLGAR